MRFEPPIAEIERFPLRDIISASGEETPEDLPTETTSDPDLDNMWDDACSYSDFRDNDDFDLEKCI